MPSTLNTWDILSPQPKVQLTMETWELDIGLAITGGET
jgi:hypothetical protein